MSLLRPQLKLIESSPPVAEANCADPVETTASDWIAWQLADSAFPTGGFAHSGGLEAAWQHREVRNGGELVEFIKAGTMQIARGILPIMLKTFDQPEKFGDWDDFCGAFLTNHVSHRASRLQGCALLASARNAFGERLSEAGARPDGCHLAPVFGIVTRRLNLAREQSARLFVFWHLRGWFGSAVRLGMIGSNEAQALQFKLRDFVDKTVQAAVSEPEFFPHQTAPLLEIWQATQDRMYSRLFQS